MSPQIVESNDIEKNLKVRCEVRCRIPTADKGEFYVHLYSNNLNNKQHLAIVAGPYIYSKSLNEVRENDTDEKRMIRGATIKPNVTLPIKSVNKNDLEKGRYFEIYKFLLKKGVIISTFLLRYYYFLILIL